MANPTAENIIENVRKIIRGEAGSDAPVVQNEFLYEAIMDGQNKWSDAFQQGGEDQISSQRETGFDLVADTTLDEASGITSTDTEFTVTDNLSYDATDGALLIWDDNMPDFVNYTTYTSGTKTFSGVTGIGFNHEDDDALQKLYKLPTNFGSFRESVNWGDGVQVMGIPYKFINGIPVPGFFSLYDDGTNKFLVLPRGLTGTASVLFNAAYNTIDSSEDIVGVPETAKFFLVYHCVAMCYLGRDDDANKMLFAQQQSEMILSRVLRNRNTGKKIRTRSFGRTARDYTAIGGATYPFFYS